MCIYRCPRCKGECDYNPLMELFLCFKCGYIPLSEVK